jgi:3-isopropylmalate/(R)-2-methylmalate dehydratase small subunit
MEKFQTLHTTGVPLPFENVDTDQIIPARFLKATTREGFGENLFRDWRYNTDGSPKADFVLNNARCLGALRCWFSDRYLELLRRYFSG